MLMSNTVILAMQALPKVKDGNTSAIVDKVIKVIQKSGVKYKICPFETVMEGSYDKLIQIVDDARKVCIDAGVEEVLFNIKIELRPNKDVTIVQKTIKYDG